MREEELVDPGPSPFDELRGVYDFAFCDATDRKRKAGSSPPSATIRPEHQWPRDREVALSLFRPEIQSATDHDHDQLVLARRP